MLIHYIRKIIHKWRKQIYVLCVALFIIWWIPVALVNYAETGNTARVKWLLHHGADPNAGDIRPGDALFLASQNGHLEVVKLLLKAGAKPDRPYNSNEMAPTALEAAVWFGQTEIVRQLLAAGADPNLTNASERTPLGDAEGKGYSEIAALLKNAGGKK